MNRYLPNIVELQKNIFGLPRGIDGIFEQSWFVAPPFAVSSPCQSKRKKNNIHIYIDRYINLKWRQKTVSVKATEKVTHSWVKLHYYSSKIFPQFWLAKSTRIIHHNQLLMTKFGRILCLTRKWPQKCSPLQVTPRAKRLRMCQVEHFRSLF